MKLMTFAAVAGFGELTQEKARNMAGGETCTLRGLICGTMVSSDARYWVDVTQSGDGTTGE